MQDYVAAIDAGTGGVRCAIFDARGRMAAQAYRELATRYTPDGRAEQDPRALIDGAMDAAAQAVRDFGQDPAAIRGVSFTGTQSTFLPVDREGRPLSLMILWQDARGIDMFPLIRRRLAEQGLTEEDLYLRTLRPLDGVLAGAKLLWMKTNEPALYERIRRVRNPQAVLLRAFGAEDDTLDPSDGGWWLCHDTPTLAVDDTLTRAFGLDPGHIPALRPSGTRVGSLAPSVATRTGLRAGTPLYQGAVDQCCAMLGAGNAGDPALATACLGTAGCVMACMPEPRPDPHRHGYVIHYPTGGFASEIAMPVAASAFRWVRDVLCPASAFEPEGVYARMDAEAQSVPIGSGGLCFLPQLAGNIYPALEADRRGGWIGVGLSTTRAAMIRAALEGICLETRRLLSASGSAYQALRLLGGASRSPLWTQMLSDVCRRPVETVAAEEASALGAAMIAATSAGLYPTLPDAVRGMSRLKARLEPDPARADRYDEVYDAWLRCADALRPAFPALSGLRGGARP